MKPAALHEVKLELIRDYVSREQRDGAPLSARPYVRSKLARLSADVETAKMLQRRVISVASQGGVPTVEAAMCKLYLTQCSQRISDVMLDILGPQGLLHKSGPDAPFAGKWEWAYRAVAVDTIGAGTSEIQKNIIARRGLNLPLTN